MFDVNYVLETNGNSPCYELEKDGVKFICSRQACTFLTSVGMVKDAKYISATGRGVKNALTFAGGISDKRLAWGKRDKTLPFYDLDSDYILQFKQSIKIIGLKVQKEKGSVLVTFIIPETLRDIIKNLGINKMSNQKDGTCLCVSYLPNFLMMLDANDFCNINVTLALNLYLKLQRLADGAIKIRPTTVDNLISVVPVNYIEIFKHFFEYLHDLKSLKKGLALKVYSGETLVIEN